VRTQESPTAPLSPQRTSSSSPYPSSRWGPTKEGRKEFWWKWEWCHAGHFSFEPDHVVVAFAPADEQASFQTSLKETNPDEYDGLTFVDANWDLNESSGPWLTSLRPTSDLFRSKNQVDRKDTQEEIRDVFPSLARLTIGINERQGDEGTIRCRPSACRRVQLC